MHSVEGDEELVWTCCSDKPTVIAFRVACKDDITVIVLACAEHEMDTGVLLASMRPAHD